MTRGLLHCGVEVCFTWIRGPVACARPWWLAFVSGWHWSLTPSWSSDPRNHSISQAINQAEPA